MSHLVSIRSRWSDRWRFEVLGSDVEILFSIQVLVQEGIKVDACRSGAAGVMGTENGEQKGGSQREGVVREV